MAPVRMEPGKRWGTLGLLSLTLLGAWACEARVAESPEAGGGDGVLTLEWVDLLPASDLHALLNPPEWLDEIAEGSMDDRIDSAFLEQDEAGRRYQAALRSTTVMQEFDQARVRVPGFVVPLEFDQEDRVIEFFLVPYFGACVHLPPPPPNQLIHVRMPDGILAPHPDDAIWVDGVLETALTDHELGTAAYVLHGEGWSLYTEDHSAQSAEGVGQLE